MLLLPLFLQVAGPVLPAAPRPRSAAPCPVATDTADVIVCAPNQESYRLHPLAPRYQREQGLPKAEVGVFGNAKLAAEAEQAGDGRGGVVNRAMVRLKIPLGGRKKQSSP